LQRKKAADTVVGNSYNMEKSNYYKKEAEPRTNKATFMDFDSGLAIAYKSATPPSAKPLL
jgi:ketol-acid reductoisomerase